MTAHPSPIRARVLLNKSVAKKFPKFTKYYPNPAPGARVPGFRRVVPLRACNVGLCERFMACGPVLAGFLTD